MKNTSGCACIFAEDGETLERICDAHALWKHRAAEARCTICDKHDSYFEGEWKERAEKAEARLKPIEEINQRFDINAVIKVTEYKYFGDYEFSEPQRVAVAKLVEMAEAIKKCCEKGER